MRFIMLVLCACSTTPFSATGLNATDTTSDTGQSDPQWVNGKTFYNDHLLGNVKVALLYVVGKDGQWGNIDASIVAEEGWSDSHGVFTLTAPQLGSYWLLGEIGNNEFSGILVDAQQIELTEFGETTITDLHLQEMSHYNDSGFATSCSCELYWSDIAYTCCPSETGEEVCSWQWDNCLED